MKLNLSFLEPLFDKVGQFGQLNMDLLRLKILDKLADFVSSFIARMILVIILSSFLLFLSIATALWLGELLGKHYYGFFIISILYGIIAIFILYFQQAIKLKMSDWFITKMLK